MDARGIARRDARVDRDRCDFEMNAPFGGGGATRTRSSSSSSSSSSGDEDARRAVHLLQNQIRAQAREIARLQREVVDAHRERDALAGEVMKPLDVRFKDCVRDLIRETTWFRLRSVEETIEVELELPELAPMKPVEYL